MDDGLVCMLSSDDYLTFVLILILIPKRTIGAFGRMVATRCHSAGDSYFYPPPSFVSHPSKDERSKEARSEELVGPTIAQS